MTTLVIPRSTDRDLCDGLYEPKEGCIYGHAYLEIGGFEFVTCNGVVEYIQDNETPFEEAVAGVGLTRAQLQMQRKTCRTHLLVCDILCAG